MQFNITNYEIRKFTKNGVVYVMGYKLYEEGAVKRATLSRYIGNNKLEVRAMVKDGYVVEDVRITFDANGNILNSTCSCSKSKCSHSAALLFDMLNSKDYQSVKKVNIAADDMFRVFEKIEQKYFDEETARVESPVEIMAELEFWGLNSLKCRFSIGRERMYKIKNINRFISQYRNGETVKFGKNLIVMNYANEYSENALKAIDFMGSSNSARDYMRIVCNDSIGIFSDNADNFFDIFKDIYTVFHFTSNYGEETESKVVEFCDGEKPVKIKICPFDGGYEFYIEGDIDYKTKSKRYGYILSGEKFCRVDLKYMECVENFTKILHGNKVECLRIEDSDLTKFVTSVLPSLIRVGLVQDYEELQEKAGCYPLKAKIYIDFEGDNAVLTGKYQYGENEADIMDLKDVSEFPRNRVKEKNIKRVIELLGFIRDNNKYILNNSDLIYELYTSGIKQLNDVAEVYTTDAFKFKNISSNNNLYVGFRLKGDLLEMDFDSTLFDYSEIEDVMKSYRIKKRYHRFKDGRFMDFSDGAFDRELKLLDNLEISKSDNGHFTFNKYRALSLNRFLRENNVFNVEYNEEFEKLAEDFANFNQLDIPIPQTVASKLRDYQKTGFRWLKTLEKYGFGGILADDMGLGKTLQAITLILSYAENKKPSIIVCPTSLIYNWQNEINKFAPELQVKVIAGNANQRKKNIDEITASVYITTYDTLKRDIEYYSDYDFKYIIADEAQAIKNPKTQNSKAIRKLKGSMRIALTGTPVENSLTELWAVFDFLMPGYLFNMSKFDKNFSVPIMKNNDEEKQKMLKNMVLPFVLRRIKKDVLTELPEKIETTLYAEMNKEQRKIYMAYFLESKNDVNSILNKSNGGRIEVFTILTRLRQICCHPSLFIDNYENESGKLELTIETINNLIPSGHRILIFSQFTSMLDLIGERLNKEKIDYFYLCGETTSIKRMEMVEKFNKGENSVFLISLKAGGTGLNLTGADVVIHYDPWWNPAVMNQASDRAHRIGQKRSVHVFNMIAKDTIEEKILALQEKKKALTDNIITDGEGFFSQMTKEEILGLFEEQYN